MHMGQVTSTSERASKNDSDMKNAIYMYQRRRCDRLAAKKKCRRVHVYVMWQEHCARKEKLRYLGVYALGVAIRARLVLVADVLASRARVILELVAASVVAASGRLLNSLAPLMILLNIFLPSAFFR